MAATLQELITLHRTDVELAAVQKESSGVPSLRDSLATARTESEAREQAAQDSLKAAQHDHREAEAALADAEALVLRLEGQTTQIKTNAAYGALLREIEGAKGAISNYETRILELMDSIEECKTTEQRCQEEEQAGRITLDKEASDLDAREEFLAKEAVRLEASRTGAVEAVDPSWLSYYSRILHRRQPAVSVLTREMCLACRVQVPALRCMEILAGDTLVTCEGCHRILVHERHVGEAIPS